MESHDFHDVMIQNLKTDIEPSPCIQIPVVSKEYWFVGQKYRCYETSVDGSDDATLWVTTKYIRVEETARC